MSLNKPSLFAAAMVLALCASDVWAQGIKDMRRVSPMELMPVTDDAATVSGEMPPYIRDENAGPVTIPADVGITITPATSISIDTLGIYDQRSGGVAFDVWDGSSHERVRQLLTHMPHTIPSSTVRKLVARLLLSSTRPPESLNIQQNVFRPRIQTLMHIDEVAQAQRLLEMVPQDARTEQTARLEYTAHLLRGDADWVCGHVASALQSYTQDVAYWQKLSIFCNARAKDEAKVQLALDVLSEQQVKLADGFVDMVQVMLGRSNSVTVRFANPLAADDAALIAISGVDAFPDSYMQLAPLPVARLVQGNEALPQKMREEAGKRLSAAIAADTPRPERVKVRGWFERQFTASPEEPVDFDALAEQMHAQSADKADAAMQTRRRYRLYTLLQALTFSNISAAEPWKDATFRDSSRIYIAPALRSEMATAVDSERKGESILLVAMAAGQVDNLADVDDASIADMVQALMQLGYTAEAQALATEAMISLY
jgi:hypothetical protein